MWAGIFHICNATSKSHENLDHAPESLVGKVLRRWQCGGVAVLVSWGCIVHVPTGPAAGNSAGI